MSVLHHVLVLQAHDDVDAYDYLDRLVYEAVAGGHKSVFLEGFARDVLSGARTRPKRKAGRPSDPIRSLCIVNQVRFEMEDHGKGEAMQRVADDLGVEFDTIRYHIRRCRPALRIIFADDEGETDATA